MLGLRPVQFVAFLLVVVGVLPMSARAGNSGAAVETPALQLPAIPAPAPVQLDASRTAFLVLDLMDRICSPDPNCVSALPSVAAGLASARAAGVFVVYTTSPPGSILSDVAPAPGDPIISAHADKFYDSSLDATLQQAGVTTLVITGSSTTGAVLYTSYEATLRGYTVVVPEDAVVSHSDFIQLYSQYQLLNQSGLANPDNAPLKSDAVTLSRTDLIAYR
jgi:nicotinamidase-related amidase